MATEDTDIHVPVSNDFLQNVLDFLFDVVVEADKATRALGEEDVKGMIQPYHAPASKSEAEESMMR